MKVAGVVEEVNGQCDMVHQDAGNFKTRSDISLLLGTFKKSTVQRRESSRRC